MTQQEAIEYLESLNKDPDYIKWKNIFMEEILMHGYIDIAESFADLHCPEWAEKRSTPNH